VSGAAPLVLASTSRSRQALLARLEVPFEAAAHRFDERGADAHLTALGVHGLALHLARGKAESLADAHPSQAILAADQLAVLAEPDGPTLLHKPASEAAAVAQLMRLRGRSHRLVTGVVLLHRPAGPGQARASSTALDEQHLHMRAFDEAEAAAYVARYQPLDSCGAYHIEDAGIRLFERIASEDYTGIIGLPLLAVARLLREGGLM